MSISSLKFLFLSMSVVMIGIVIKTSIASDLFHLPASVVTEPWFTTTLADFYNNIAILAAWVIYKEANWLRSTLWILAFIFLGSIATAFYVYLQLASLKEGQGVKEVLLRKGV